ncbi:type VII secretion protein EsxI, partial [Mycobacterium tuberculosis]
MPLPSPFGAVAAPGALLRAPAASLAAAPPALVRAVLAAGAFWGGAGSVACP